MCATVPTACFPLTNGLTRRTNEPEARSAEKSK